MKSLLSKGKLVAILRNEEKWEILLFLNENLEFQRFSYDKSINCLLKEISNYYHRSILDDRKIISKQYGYDQKVPMMINANDLLLFPTRSLENKHCVLLNYYCIHEYKKKDKNTLIEFCIPYNNSKIILNERLLVKCDIRTIKNQILRCIKINDTLKQRNVI